MAAKSGKPQEQAQSLRRRLREVQARFRQWKHMAELRPGCPPDVRAGSAKKLFADPGELGRILDFSNDAVFIHDLKGRILNCNDPACRMLGYDKDHLVGMSVRRLAAPNAKAMTEQAFRKLRRQGWVTLENRLRDASGQELDVEISARVIDRQRGLVQGVVRDIRPRKKAEEAFRQSEERFRAMIQSLHGMAMLVLDRKGRYLFAQISPEFVRKHKLKASDLVGRTVGEVFGPQGGRQRMAAVNKVLRTGKPVSVELHTQRPTTHWWQESTFSPIRDASGAITSILMTVNDVTARHEAEQTLRESRERLRMIVESLHGVSVFVVDRDGRCQFAQMPVEMERRYGYKAAGFVGKVLADFLAPRDGRRRLRDARKVFDTGKPVRAEYFMAHRHGTFWQETTYSPIHDVAGAVTGVLAVVRDIQERKEAEDALRNSEGRLRAVIASMVGTVIAVVDRDGRLEYIHISPELEKKYGLLAADLGGKKLSDIFSPQEAQARVRLIRKVFRTGKPVLAEMPAPHPKGVFWQETLHSPIVGPDGKVTAVLSMVRDITERNKAEQALRDSEERYRRLFDHSNDAIFIHRLGGEFVDINGRACEMFGYTRRQFLKMRITDLNVSEELAHLKRARAEVRRNGSALFETHLRHGDGRALDVEVSSRMVDPDRQVVESLVRDITTRKQAQAAMQESEERFRDLFENAPLCIFEEDVSVSPGVILRANRKASQTYGYTQDEFRMLPVEKIIPVRFQQDLGKTIEAVSRKGTFAVESVNRRKDGTKFPIRVMVSASPTLGARRAIVMIEDVTQEKKAEEALRETNEKLQYIIDNAWDVIFQLDLKGNFTFGNMGVQRLSGYPLEELLRMNMFQIIAPEYHKLVRERMMRRIAGEDVAQPFEYEMLDRKGRRIFLEATTTAVERNGKLVAVQGIARDVTARRQAEAALRESERRMRLILQYSTDGINIVELNPQTGGRRLVMCNDRYVEMTGRTREELMGAEDLDVFSVSVPRYISNQPERFRRLLSGQSIRGVASWLRPDGKENYFEWTAAPFRVGDKIYIVGIDRDITERRRQEKALDEAHLKLATAREEERRHLAGELHDSIGQGMVAMQLAIRGILPEADSINRPDLAAAIKQASSQVDGLIREVRAICHGLYPPTLESLGLYSAMTQLARDFQAETKVQIHWDIPDKGGRFSREAEIAIFRIAQEAISNAVRHGHASLIDVSVGYRQERAILTVSDNGKGFTVGQAGGPPPGGGLGMSMMRERVDTVGGEFDVKSSQEGTVVRAMLITPLRPSTPASE